MIRTLEEFDALIENVRLPTVACVGVGDYRRIDTPAELATVFLNGFPVVQVPKERDGFSIVPLRAN